VLQFSGLFAWQLSEQQLAESLDTSDMEESVLDADSDSESSVDDYVLID
jgi:hypothetical protein